MALHVLFIAFLICLLCILPLIWLPCWLSCDDATALLPSRAVTWSLDVEVVAFLDIGIPWAIDSSTNIKRAHREPEALYVEIPFLKQFDLIRRRQTLLRLWRHHAGGLDLAGMASGGERRLASLRLEVENVLNVACDPLYHLSSRNLTRLLRLPAGCHVGVGLARITSSITGLQIDVKSLGHVAINREDRVQHIDVGHFEQLLNEQVDINRVRLLHALP